MTADPRGTSPSEQGLAPIGGHDGEDGQGHDAGESPGAVCDERYSGMDWPTQPDLPLTELAGALDPGRAIDLGCGPGRNAIWLARQGWRVTAVDASAVGLAQAKERAAREGLSLQLVQADLLSYVPAPASFDLVVVANLHLAPEQRAPFFARAVAAVAPGGHIFVIGHHLDSLGRVGPPFPERLYTEALLTELLAPLEVEFRRHERSLGDGGSLAVDAVAWARAPQTSGV